MQHDLVSLTRNPGPSPAASPRRRACSCKFNPKPWTLTCIFSATPGLPGAGNQRAYRGLNHGHVQGVLTTIIKNTKVEGTAMAVTRKDPLLQDADGWTVKPGAGPQAQGGKADIEVKHVDSGFTSFIDLTIVHPNVNRNGMKDADTKTGVAAEFANQAKLDKQAKTKVKTRSPNKRNKLLFLVLVFLLV